MAYTNPYGAYKETNVRTASPAQLIILLYDEAIKQLHSAQLLLGENGKIDLKQIDKFNAHVLKTQDIITELSVSLNMDIGGDIAKNLLNLYTYFNQELFDANINRNKEKLAFISSMLSELRSSWITIANTAPTPTNAAQTRISING